MKRNKEISGSNAQKNAKNAIKGSTMIAVLAAMLFIGVVTASMVKNTKSQSTASMGYGIMSAMASTVRSGMIATETYFRNNWDGVKEKLEIAANAPETDKDAKRPFIYGESKKKNPLSTSQFFNSRIFEVKQTTGHPKYISFEVNAGRGQGGKNLKKALVYYGIDNSDDIKIEDESEFGGMASFAAVENGTVDAGNSGANFHGHVTFEKGLYLQNNKPVSFVNDNNGEGSVYIGGETKILNSQPVTFEVDAYFDDDVSIQNVPNSKMFEKNAGFNKNITVANLAGGSHTIEFGGDVWYNGDFKNTSNPNNAPDIYFKPDSPPNNKFYYTDKIKMKTNAMAYGGCNAGVNCAPNSNPTKSFPCCPHGGVHISAVASTNMKDFDMSGYLGQEINDIPQLMANANKNANNGVNKGMTSDRKEPSLTLDNVTKDEDGNSTGKDFLNIFEKDANGWNYAILNAGGQLDGAKLQEFYDKAQSDSKYKDKYFSDNGHLLLTIPAGTNVDTKGGTFNGKVIFNVEGALNGDASFYSSTSPDASTLVYVGKNGVLSQFGVGADKTFQGLVYIDSSNHKQQSFAWGKDSQIQGAVIVKGGNLYWNANSSVMDIYRNNDVLKNYAFLKTDGATNSKKTVEHKNPGDGVILSAWGYYFF